MARTVLSGKSMVVTCGHLLVRDEPHNPKDGPKGGRTPMLEGTMLQIHFLQ